MPSSERASGEAAPAASVVGTWKLAGGSMNDPSGKQVGVPYGPRGMGLVTLTSDGRMMAVLIDGRARLRTGASANTLPIAATTRSTAAP